MPSPENNEVRLNPTVGPRRRYIFPDGRVAMLTKEEIAEEEGAYYDEMPKSNGTDPLHNKKSPF